MIVRHLDVEFREVWLPIKALLRNTFLVFNPVNYVLDVGNSVVTPILIVPLSGFELTERPKFIVFISFIELR